jgi:hypothetical protein
MPVGTTIHPGSAELTSKGQVEKDYQTPYGVATVARHVYQSNQGGATYCASPYCWDVEIARAMERHKAWNAA